MITDWERYRKCPACYAPLGKPCVQVLGPTTRVTARKPHGGRKLRTGATREGGDR